MVTFSCSNPSHGRSRRQTASSFGDTTLPRELQSLHRLLIFTKSGRPYWPLVLPRWPATANPSFRWLLPPRPRLHKNKGSATSRRKKKRRDLEEIEGEDMERAALARERWGYERTGCGGGFVKSRHKRWTRRTQITSANLNAIYLYAAAQNTDRPRTKKPIQNRQRTIRENQIHVSITQYPLRNTSNAW